MVTACGEEGLGLFIPEVGLERGLTLGVLVGGERVEGRRAFLVEDPAGGLKKSHFTRS